MTQIFGNENKKLLGIIMALRCYIKKKQDSTGGERDWV